MQDRSSLVEALDGVVAGSLFTVALRLDDAVAVTDGELRSCLESAVRDVDECIAEVRRIVLDLDD